MIAPGPVAAALVMPDVVDDLLRLLVIPGHGEGGQPIKAWRLNKPGVIHLVQPVLGALIDLIVLQD